MRGRVSTQYSVSKEVQQRDYEQISVRLEGACNHELIATVMSKQKQRASHVNPTLARGKEFNGV